jgi:hypothetical protein
LPWCSTADAAGAKKLVARLDAWHHRHEAHMFVGLIDTRGDRPDPNRPEPLVLDLPELRPWRWYVVAIVCLVAAMKLDGWPSLIPLMVGFGCFLRGASSYYQGNDGLSKYRQ